MHSNIHNYAYFIVEELPGPEEEFTRKGIIDQSDHDDEWVREQVQSLAELDVIKSERTFVRDSSRVARWVIPEKHHERAQNIVEERWSPLPCEHNGLRNCGDYLTCQYEGCSAEYSREEVDL